MSLTTFRITVIIKARENYIDWAKPNTIVEFNGWQQPTKGMDVFKKGRSINIRHRKVVGKLHFNARISIGEQILVTSEWAIISGRNRPFMRAGDSGSAVCRWQGDGQTTVGVVGIMFGGSVGSQADFTFFMPTATVAIREDMWALVAKASTYLHNRVPNKWIDTGRSLRTKRVFYSVDLLHGN